MAHIDATLMQQIFDVAKRKREPDVVHNRQANDLGRRLEVTEWRWFAHTQTLRARPAPIKAGSSDKTVATYAAGGRKALKVVDTAAARRLLAGIR